MLPNCLVILTHLSIFAPKVKKYPRHDKENRPEKKDYRRNPAGNAGRPDNRLPRGAGRERARHRFHVGLALQPQILHALQQDTQSDRGLPRTVKKTAMKKIDEILSRRNRLYSKLLRENITNRDILSVHALLVALYLVCLAIETLLP